MLSSPSIPPRTDFSPQQSRLRPLVGLLSRLPVTVLVWRVFALFDPCGRGAQLTLGDVGVDPPRQFRHWYFCAFLPKGLAMLKRLPPHRWLMIAQPGAGLPFFGAAWAGAQNSATHVGRV